MNGFISSKLICPAINYIRTKNVLVLIVGRYIMINQSSQIKATLNDHISFRGVVKGIIVSYLITVPAFMIFALILNNSDYSEKYISPVVFITTIIGIILAGSTATRGVKNKGWLNGSIVGVIYMFVLYLAGGVVFQDFTVDRHIITMFFIGILSGAIGGIIGINFKRSSRSRIRSA